MSMSQKKHGIPHNPLSWLDIVFLLLTVLYVLFGITLVPFHGDESTYIILSEDYDRIKQGHIERVLYDPDDNPKQYLRLSTGSILAFSIGVARDIIGYEGTTNKWLWGATWEYNVAHGNMPEMRLLYMARACSALMGVTGIILLFLTAWRLFSSRLAAWSAVLLFVTNGPILVNIRRAMQEGPKFLFLILTIYFATYVIKSFQDGKMRRYPYALLGVASGLTLAAKQDTVPVLVAVYLALGLIPLWKREALRTILTNLFYLGVSGVLAYVFFLAFMPVFWNWWGTMFMLMGLAVILFQLPMWKIDRMAKPFVVMGLALVVGMTLMKPSLYGEILTPVESMVETREAILKGDLQGYVGQGLFDPTIAKSRITFLLNSTVRTEVMYMEVESFDVPPFHEQIVAYEDSLFSGRVGSPLLDGLVLVLFIVGAIYVLRDFNVESLLVCSLFVVSSFLLFAMIPSPWQRYFLIMQIPYSLLAGAGIHQVWIFGKRVSDSYMRR
jgi:4-amino-4-deoxy-L-arabinose transferase-like glycosyltransferase